MPEFTVRTIVGSLSEKSINRKLFRALDRLAPEAGLQLVELPIKDLPLYNHDFDADYPEVATQLKNDVEAADAVLIVTPEYNRSMPAGVKNALDWASRPWGTNSFDGKPAAVIGTSPGAIGTAIAQNHVRGVLAFLAAPTLAQPEAYIQDRPGLIDDEGEIADESTRAFLVQYLTAFREHIAKTLRAER
ncbi:NADPH-dependent FMN reductase [Gulosibacter sp. 10]|uniref:NADPH-dependent FMN reductase n=1 Tax=Gulosibacter sp. 10 TaxID=1255570 RepID=UPI00097EEBC4|nr:NADPH-dependent FMN reductase [Gulosibacter sp. 10]SJM63414.1 NADPH:quinone oxidoreductase [Gulosibacter sp. 10]